MYSKTGATWSYLKSTIKLEPFDETPLRGKKYLWGSVSM